MLAIEGSEECKIKNVNRCWWRKIDNERFQETVFDISYPLRADLTLESRLLIVLV